MTKVAFYTLGCRSNQYETDRMIEQVRSLGYEIVPYPQAADIYVINTCTVTSNAAKKSRNAIRHSKKLNPRAKVIFTGCDAGIEDITEADITLLNKDKLQIVEYLRDARRETRDVNTFSSPISHLPSRVRANLMIEDGCQNFCSYCIVPLVRGKVRSRPMDEILCEAEKMVASGVKEIVLTGINLGEFTLEPETKSLGSEAVILSEAKNLKKQTLHFVQGDTRNRACPPLAGLQSQVPLLINQLSKIDGLSRIRLSSIEPQYVTDELIDVIKSDPKVCHHLHIPLQSGDDGILKAMKRRYTSKQYLDLANKIKKKIKDIAITTDIIVGFPGEDEKAFRNTYKLAEKIKFSRIHVFSYSDRPGTAAMGFKDKVDPKTIARRYEKLTKLRDKLMLRFHRSFKGKVMEVLIEQKDKKTGMFEGLTGNYIRVFLSDNKRTDLFGKIVKCGFSKFQGETVIAKMRP